MGTLVDEGKMDWDAPVRTYIPEIRFHDHVATELITPRDLVTHRSGLPRHDLVWYNANLSRKEVVARLPYLEPSEPFRSKFQYNNVMFMTAGYLDRAPDRPVVGRRGARADFQAADDDLQQLLGQGLAAKPRLRQAVRRPRRQGRRDPVSRHHQCRDRPARSTRACEDMSRWLVVQTHKGKIDGSK